MQVRRQSPSDMSSINKWIKARGLNLISEQSYHSFIIPGVAAGQFLMVEGKMMIFDGLITNPHVSAPTRNKALNSLVSHMIQFSVEQGVAILAVSTDTSTVSRAKAFGFVQQPHVVLTYKGNN
jgi:hypothetical protein